MDYYAVLGLDRSANGSDIKRAYRKLASKWHPDKNPGNTEYAVEQFQMVAEAYDVLSNRETRAVYDQFGHEGLQNGVPDSNGNVRGAYRFGNNAQEIFERFFGTSNPFSDFGFSETLPFASRLRKPGPRKADPVTHELPCTLEELFNGCTKRFTATRKRYDPAGELQDEQKLLTIDIRPGWKKGTKITFANQGDEGPDTVPADIIFVLTEEAHANYAREGNNLVFTADISLADALTDCSVQVPTLDGRVLSLPCNEVVSPAFSKTIAGEGMPIAKRPNERGDLVVRFNIQFPTHIEEARRVELRRLLNPDIPLRAPAPAAAAAPRVVEEE